MLRSIKLCAVALGVSMGIAACSDDFMRDARQAGYEARQLGMSTYQYTALTQQYHQMKISDLEVIYDDYLKRQNQPKSAIDQELDDILAGVLPQAVAYNKDSSAVRNFDDPDKIRHLILGNRIAYRLENIKNGVDVAQNRRILEDMKTQKFSPFLNALFYSITNENRMMRRRWEPNRSTVSSVINIRAKQIGVEL